MFLVLDCNIFLPFKIIKKEKQPFKKKKKEFFCINFSSLVFINYSFIYHFLKSYYFRYSCKYFCQLSTNKLPNRKPNPKHSLETCMLFLYIARFTIMVQFTVNLLGVISNLLGDSVSNKIITTFIISCHMDISQNINSHVVMGHGSNSLYLEIMVLHDCINGIAVGRNVLFIKIRKKFLPSLKILS